MKFTLSWLADHLDTQAPLDDITEALTDCGLEVENVDDATDEYGAFSVCRVMRAEKHPNADKLKVCQLEVWPKGPENPSETVQVVCGAPNARAGMIGIFAPPGAILPDSGTRLKKSKIRGVESAGILCSERELKISDDHEGVIETPPDTPLGISFIEYAGLNDPVVEIGVTPNRPDALGVRGIARDLAARGLGTLKPMTIDKVQGQFPCPISIHIDDDAKPHHCPVFFGRVIRNVKNGSSPKWMQERLKAIGLRPISALVDITNYVTYDQNRPLHVFDAKKVKGGLRIHLAKGGETLTALDDNDYTLSAGQIVISDSQGPESIAGIMGGLSTGCSEDTTDVFLESALWDPTITATTGRQLRIHSDARYRFERGVDPEFARPGLEVATQMILDICGGEPSEVAYDGQVPQTRRSFELRKDRVRCLAGMDVTPDKQKKILINLGFSVEDNGDKLAATPPSWRPDIHGEADLVEEIARMTSLTELKGIPLPRPAPGIAKPILLPEQKHEMVCRRAIASLGYNECLTYSFIDKSTAQLFIDKGRELVELENPISSELNVMRPDLLPGLLKAAATNQSRGSVNLALFEVGPVFHGAEAGEETLCASGLLTGNRAPREPHSSSRPVDLYDAKADALAALTALFPSNRFKLSRHVPSWMHPQRSGCLSLQPGKPLAIFGEVNPKILRQLGHKLQAVTFTLFLNALPQPKSSKGLARPTFSPHPLQPVDRDFAFILANNVEAAEVVAAAETSRFHNLISQIQIFDEYSGPAAETHLEEGCKSIAINVRLQPQDKPLKDADLEAICADIANKVEALTGGQLRG